jgi:hypothetical protein
MLKSFIIDDSLEIQDTGAVEVTVEMHDGEKRWCYFVTPQALAACGDWIDGTQIRFHYGAAHMIIVVAPTDAVIIEKALRDIERAGHLYKATISLM